MKKVGRIVAIAWWVYFLTAIFLYIHFGFKWVNTIDVLLSFALLITFSVWYVIEKSRGPGKSRWVIGWMGLHRRKSEDCSAQQRK
jgi:membrane protease YdiL (CAAX protease family)